MSCVPVGPEQAVSSPHFDINNRFAVLGASVDEDEAASREDIEDKPNAPTSAATFTTEDYASCYPDLDSVLVQVIVSSLEAPDDIIEKLDEMRAEAELQQQDAEEATASRVGLEDKPNAPTSAATVEKVVSSLDFIGLEAKIELQEPKLLDIEDKADTTLKVPRDPPSPPCVNCFYIDPKR